MIVCWRTVRIPAAERERFRAWIQANRAVRERHGILFELVLDRSPRQNPPKASQPPPAAPSASAPTGVVDAVVVTAWASHDAFDAWINTPNRDRLTASPANQAVQYGRITRYDTTSGYLNLDGLCPVADALGSGGIADAADLDSTTTIRKEQP